MWLACAYEQAWFGKTNFPEALKWFRKSAEQGNPDAQNELGQMYENGEGVTQNYALAEVRHDAHKKWSNPLRISSRSRRVYTTLAVETEAVRKADAQQVEKRFLLSGGLCNPAQSDFAAVCGGQNDVAAVQFG